MKVFLDIGAHNGETLQVVKEPRWGFDRIVCFEPAPPCWPRLEALVDDRVTINRFGLWDEDEDRLLHHAGEIGASLAAEKPGGNSPAVTCELRDAGTWFAENLTATDEVFVKINVEGAEPEIVDSLAQSGTLTLIRHLLIHFDTRKVPGSEHREGLCRQTLTEAGVEFQAAEAIQFGGVYRGTRNWLRWCSSDPRTRHLRYVALARAEHRIRKSLYPLKVRTRGFLNSGSRHV